MTTTFGEAEFTYISDMVRTRSAIVLEPGKEYLVEARLAPLVRELGLESIGALVTKLRLGTGGLADRVTEAMTTNETSFFRDVAPFHALRTSVLPSLVEARKVQRSLRIWCAASSSGQEPYSIAMTIEDAFPQLRDWNLQIVATDLSPAMVERGRSGVYKALEVNRGLPAPMLIKYFTKVGVDYELKAEIRSMVDFSELNLIGAWPAFPTFDIVFLRNVLIYFDVETKRTIFGRVKRLLAPDGFLFLGAAETTMNIDDGFERLPIERAGCYRRTTGA
ncbi:MAG TPA: protein-glutamate O-methyltransferase CheR [Acidimicrobiia bacterium]|nr:protein-glutamate O-methyltransferase CheR [Acidimicrobiia bacterium]